jgi:hypothetical protein
MAYAGLLDGGLSIKVGCASGWTGGTERNASAHGLIIETTLNGVGSASFWMECPNPFSPQTTYPELVYGARVLITHTYDATTTVLYRGFVISDARSGFAGDRGYVRVECGGPLDIARWRGDVGFVYTERDYDQWFPNKRNGNWVVVDTADSLYLGVSDGTKVPYGPSLGARCGVVGYLAYAGGDYMVRSPQLYGVRRIRGKCRWNLKDNMDAKLAYASEFKVSRDKDEYTLIKAFSANTASDGWVVFDTASTSGWVWSSPAAGAPYLVLMMWPTQTGVEVRDDRFVEFDSLEMYLTSDGNEKSISAAMLDVANFVGLHDSESVLNATVTSVEQQLAARPQTNPVAAMMFFAAQASDLVEWGWFVGATGIEWRCRPLPTELGDKTSPSGGIRYLDNCYLVSVADGLVDWDVRQPTEEALYKAVRLVYGKTAASRYPKGFPRAVIAPARAEDAPLGTGWWTSGVPGIGTNCPVLTVDFSAHNYSDARARSTAAKLARMLGSGGTSGTVTTRTDATVPIYRNGNPWPAAYIKGGDWVECEEAQSTSDPGPLYVTRSTVDVDRGVVMLEVGISQTQLIEQLEAAGGVRKIALAKTRIIKPR